MADKQPITRPAVCTPRPGEIITLAYPALDHLLMVVSLPGYLLVASCNPLRRPDSLRHHLSSPDMHEKAMRSCRLFAWPSGTTARAYAVPIRPDAYTRLRLMAACPATQPHMQTSVC